MKIRMFVIAVVLLMSGFVSAQAQKLCGCADKEYLIDALKQNQMVRQELDFQMKLILALEEKAGGKPIMPTAQVVNDLYTEIANAKRSVANADYIYSSGESMNNVDCSVTRTDTMSDCKELIKKQLYDVTQKACLANKSSRGPDKSYFEAMKMKSYLLLLMMAYQKQHEFIRQMLKSLPQNCRPNNWFGYVFYRRVQTETGVTSKPRKSIDSRNATGPYNKIRIEKNTYIGTVFVEGGKPVRAKVYAAKKIDSTSSGSGLCPVVGGAIETVHAGSEKFFAEKENEGHASFALNVLTRNTYRLDVVFSPVILTGQSILWSKASIGNCTNKIAETNSTRSVLEQVKPEGPPSITGHKIDPDSSDFLEGNEDQVGPDETFKLGDESVTKTQEIKLRWMLWRLPAK